MTQYKKIEGGLCPFTNTIKKDWVLYKGDIIEHVDYDNWLKSNLPDLTVRDYFGGIIYDNI